MRASHCPICRRLTRICWRTRRHSTRCGWVCWKSSGSALSQARQLIAWGRPLLIVIIAVSFLHLWDTIAAIRPQVVQELALPGWLYHATAAALTLAIDAAALFCLAARAVTSRAGERLRANWGLGFFLATTFLLNAAFVVRYAPALGTDIRAWVLPGLELLFAVLLPATIPIGLLAVEGALARLESARLRLLMEATALDALVRDGDAAHAVVGSTVAPQSEQHALTAEPQSGASVALPDAQAAHSLPIPQPAAAPAGLSASAYRCPRCDAPVAQPVYAAAMRWGAKWKGCARCRAPQQGVSRAGGE
jgi:hypothetical protein